MQKSPVNANLTRILLWPGMYICRFIVFESAFFISPKSMIHNIESSMR
jgi:hypothetical protein